MKREIVMSLLVAGLALTGCEQPSQQGGGGAAQTPVPVATTPEPVATQTPETTPTSTPATTETPGSTATPDPDGTPEETAADGEEISHTLTPLPGKEEMAPKITRKNTIKFETTEGDLLIEVYPDAAPNAADRFVELVESGFYDNTPVSRVVEGFVAQFGVNWREPHKEYKEKKFNDDTTYYALDRGTLAFAKSGPNTNSTQVFINFGDNSRLADPQYNFTTFGKVVEGMDVVDKFPSVGSPDMGLNQQRLWEDGGEYLESLDEKPAMIEKATVVK